MINKNNYFDNVNPEIVSTMPEALRKGHEMTVKVANGNWAMYSSSDTIRNTINLYFSKLDEYLSSRQKEAKPQRQRVQRSVTPKPERTNKQKSSSSHTPVSYPVHHVEHLEEEVKFIKRFVGLHNKTKSQNSILNFIKALQKAIVQKIISKSSKYAEEIRYIQDCLVKAYNRMEDEALIDINTTDLANMVAIAGGEQVYASIPIIKRYIGMEGKEIESRKIDAFIKQIEHAKDKGKLAEDPYSDKAGMILNSLKKYLKGKSKLISVAEAELNGLEHIVKTCGCKSAPKKALSSARKVYKKQGLSGIMTASEVVNQEYELLPFSGSWAELFGKPAKNFKMMIHGEPGAGKTTFLMKFTKYLSTLGSVLYIASEEYDTYTLKDKVRQYLNPLPENVIFSANLDEVNVGDFDFVILDSINDLKMDLEDFDNLKADNPDTAFILVLQHTKGGQFKGGKEWEHEAEIAGQVSNGKINIYKSRYGVKGSMNFF